MPLKNTCLIKEVWIKLVDNYRYKWLMGENPTKGIICMMALNQVEWRDMLYKKMLVTLDDIRRIMMI